jgi:hypothetical protein
MRLGQNLVLSVVLVALSTSVACHRKKPNIPAKAQPPTIEQPTIPPVASQPLPTPPTVTPTEPQPTTPAPAPTKSKTRRRKKPVPAPTITSNKPPQPAKPTEPAPDTNVQIQAEVPQGAANERRQQTEGLLQVAEGNLKKINRNLSDGEQSMQRQVRNFITQSRLAMQDGDLERAYNLATKAQLLSQELAK